LEDFAAVQGLVPDISHPVVPRYQLLKDDKVLADITLRLGMGTFGAELALFEYRPSRTTQLLAAFDSFVASDISQAFPTRPCAEVHGYSNPITYR
jgi:hypothetical protein